MYKASTWFIKEQIPGITISQLLSLYEAELQNQSAGNTSVKEDSIEFSKTITDWGFGVYFSQFSSFSNGVIRITDEGTEYKVDFRANSDRILTIPAIFSSVVGLLVFFLSGFSWFTLLIIPVLFVLLVAGRFLKMSITFPVYFISLRNSIERQIALYKNKF